MKLRCRFLDFIRVSLIIIWTLPQTILGVFLFFYGSLFFKNFYYYGPRGYFRYFIFGNHLSPRKRGFSLGFFGFLPSGNTTSLDQVHEYGHYLQSLILGPFYLILVGIPIFFLNLWDNLFHKNLTISARRGWIGQWKVERWATQLGLTRTN